MSGIFISYRRSDSPDATGRIYDRLVSEFGKAQVFKDVDSIPLGRDFRGHLSDIVGHCGVMLAIVGPRWAQARSDAGQRRLEDPEDFVRIELERRSADHADPALEARGNSAMIGIRRDEALLRKIGCPGDDSSLRGWKIRGQKC